MVSLSFFFFLLVTIFGVIGAMRGWAKEILVTFSVVLGIFIITVLERYVTFISTGLAIPGSINQFWMRVIIVIVLVFFGYQTPNFPRLAGGRFVREKLQDVMLGLVLGMINGFLVVGTLWYFYAQANYPYPYITPPTPGLDDAAISLVNWLPPRWLGPPMIYFAVALAFLFVIIVFI